MVFQSLSTDMKKIIGLLLCLIGITAGDAATLELSNVAPAATFSRSDQVLGVTNGVHGNLLSISKMVDLNLNSTGHVAKGFQVWATGARPPNVNCNYTPAMVTFSNYYATRSQGSGQTDFRKTNSFWLVINGLGATNMPLGGATESVAGGIRIEDVTTGYYDMFWNPYHDGKFNGSDGEMQITTSGGIAVCPHWAATAPPSYATYNDARRVWQWGIGGYGQSYIQNYYSKLVDNWNTNLGFAMMPMFWSCPIYTNANALVYGGSLDPDGFLTPAMWMRGVNTNGTCSLTFYDNLDYRLNSTNGSWANMDEATKRFEMRFGPDGSIWAYGNIYTDQRKGMTTNFTLADGTLIRVRNGIIYDLDDDTKAFMNRIQTAFTDPLASNIDNFVTAVKASGAWGKLDAIYPFVGANISSNGQNMISASYKIVWGGAFTANDATGVQGDGTGWGDTQWKPSTQNEGSLFAFVKTDGSSDSFVAASYDSTGSGTGTVIRRVGAGSYRMSWAATTANLQTVNPITAGSSGAVVRYLNGATWWYRSGVAGTTEQYNFSTVTPPNYNLYLLVGNDAGFKYNYFDGKIQGFAMGKKPLSPYEYKALHNAFVALNTALAR